MKVHKVRHHRWSHRIVKNELFLNQLQQRQSNGTLLTNCYLGHIYKADVVISKGDISTSACEHFPVAAVVLCLRLCGADLQAEVLVWFVFFVFGPPSPHNA